MRKTILDLQLMKEKKNQIVALTAYDFQTASILDSLCDLILVGDSLGNVFQGNETTLNVTLDEIIYHGRIVSRAVSSAHLCIDMPFMTYQASTSDALINIGRVIKETGAQSVKMEISFDTLETIEKVSNSGVPVVAHIGLCPQSFNVYGGYKKQGKTKEEKDYILALAQEAENYGSSIIVVEGVPDNLTEKINRLVNIPIIGIGAGKKCDGQILVTEDMLGITPSPHPSFVKNYSNIRQTIKKAVNSYKKDVKEKKFP
ncbi:MAG: 3-methyl-2-oxobutanoate hydroxymethyltransferase [Thermodesulfobacteriota bacterium]|nr:3-methyl-2-oxobutanoate hydroxymethyltransferase [Thermodesulfobacteriota bacterium]MEE2975376.1 3-methyl-2-oxobutanoate hydroxymethyltransferase [Thermodesulfobacteriota bacterium]